MNRNVRVALICAVAFCAMVGAAFASVPLYRAFCQATGFAGTARRAKEASKVKLDKMVTVTFDTNVRDLPWTFTAEQPRQDVAIGATNLAFFKVTNRGSTPLTGRAVFNIAPDQAAPYFSKLECFCFTDQTMKPGETKEFPVAYFVDPRFATGDDTQNLKDITLSYTFFPATDVRAQPAKP
jgi:cytochrome c oxidase assembly protein subunit 11